MKSSEPGILDDGGVHFWVGVVVRYPVTTLA